MNPLIPAWKNQYATLRATATRASITSLLALASDCAADVPVLAANCVEAADEIQDKLEREIAHHDKANALAPLPAPPARKPVAEPRPDKRVDGPSEPSEPKAARVPAAKWVLVLYGRGDSPLGESKCGSRSVAVSRLANWGGAVRGEVTGPDHRTEHVDRVSAMREAEGHQVSTVLHLHGTAKVRANRAPRSWFGPQITG